MNKLYFFLKNLIIDAVFFLISKIKNLVKNIIKKLIEFNWIRETKHLIIKTGEFYEEFKMVFIEIMYMIVAIPFIILKHIIISPYTLFRIIRKIFYLTRRFVKFIIWFIKRFRSHTIPLQIIPFYFKFKRRLHIIIFNIFRFYDYCIYVQHDDRVKFFFPRLKFYFRMLPLWLIFFWQLNYVTLYCKVKVKRDYIRAFFDVLEGAEVTLDYFVIPAWERKGIFALFMSLFICYTIYFLVSLIFPDLYYFVKSRKVSNFGGFYTLIYKTYSRYWELQFDFWFNTTWYNFWFANLVTLWVHLLWEFNEELEVDYEDPSYNFSRIAQERGTTILNEWYGKHDFTKLEEEDLEMMMEMKFVSKHAIFWTSIFGNNEDFGEDPDYTIKRYGKHDKQFKFKGNEDTSFVAVDEDDLAAVDELVTYWCDMENDLVTFYNTLSWRTYLDYEWTEMLDYIDDFVEFFFPLYVKYVTHVYYFATYLNKFRPRVVGEYSAYIYWYNVGEVWWDKKCYYFPWYSRYFYRVFFLVLNILRFLNPFYVWAKVKWWRKFNFWLNQSMKLKKRKSINYRFFKPKKKNNINITIIKKTFSIKKIKKYLKIIFVFLFHLIISLVISFVIINLINDLYDFLGSWLVEFNYINYFPFNYKK